MSHTSTLPQPANWNKLFEQWKLPLHFSKPVLNHLQHFLDGMLAEHGVGTLTAIHRHSWHNRDRRSLSHFLTHGKWNEAVLEQHVRTFAFEQVMGHAKRGNDPMFLLIDDTVCEKTKPSSQATCAIEGAGFHHSHLHGKKVYGHAAVQAMLRTGNLIYPFAVSRYEPEGKSKIELACDMMRQVPVSTQPMYALVDAWYPSASLLQTSSQQGIQVISGLKTNRIIYPQGIRQSIKEFATYISHADTDLVTVGLERYRVYRYEGKLNLVDNAVVLLCWKESAPLTPMMLKAFLSTDVSLTNEQILTYYSKRWAIETYFRAAKGQLGLERYQVRSKRAIDRYFILILVAAMCCTYLGNDHLLQGIYHYRQQKAQDYIDYIYGQAQAGVSLEHIKKQLRVA